MSFPNLPLRNLPNRAKLFYASIPCATIPSDEAPPHKDKYGHTLADVRLLDRTHVSHTLVKDGWCWWYRLMGRSAADAAVGVAETEIT